jgi:transcriptional regulator with XRE-family HTH domain
MPKQGFIDRLVKARSALGWSQADLARASGISATQLSRYESGLNGPRINMIGRLAKALNVQFDWLAYGKGPIEGENTQAATPSGFISLEMELSEDEMKDVQRFAQTNNLSVEMAVRQLTLRGLTERTKAMTPQSLGAYPPEELASLKKLVAEVEKRLTNLEGH